MRARKFIEIDVKWFGLVRAITLGMSWFGVIAWLRICAIATLVGGKLSATYQRTRSY